MKRSIYYILSVLCFLGSSCENELAFNPDNKPTKLVVNALLSTEAETNYIYLNLTGKDKLTPLADASVYFQINDLPAEKAEQKKDSNPHDGGVFVLSPSIRPGDRIRIDARTNDTQLHAWTEVTVPEVVPIEKWDTLTTMIKKYGSFREHLRCQLTFTDPGTGNNFYRIVIQHEAQITRKDKSTNEVQSYTVNKHSVVVRDDIVLTDGYLTGMDEDDILFDRPQNIYAVFNDNRISGETYTMTVYTETPSYPYIEYEEGAETHVKVDLHIRLLSITETEYYYLRALNEFDSESYDPITSAPMFFPSNVEGGLGIVGASSESYIVLPMIDKVIEGYRYDY